MPNCYIFTKLNKESVFLIIAINSALMFRNYLTKYKCMKKNYGLLSIQYEVKVLLHMIFYEM